MRMAKRILVPLREREADEAIVPLVGAVARETGATIRLLRVFPVPQHVVGPYGRAIAYVDQEMDRLIRQGAVDLEAAAEIHLAGVPVETAVRFGDPVEEIVIEANAFDADLIALGATPRSRLGTALVPGVADKVTEKAKVPTLVLRG